MRKILAIISFFPLTVTAADGDTCFGNREYTLKAVSRIVDQFECTIADSVGECRDSVAIGVALAGVAGTVAVKSAMRLKAQDLCRAGKANLGPGLLPLLLELKTADALPKVCSINPSAANHALDQHLRELEKGIDEELKLRKEAIGAAEKHLQTRVTAETMAKRFTDLDNVLKYQPEKYMFLQATRGGGQVVNQADVAAKRALIKEFLENYKGKISGLELERYCDEMGQKIVNGLASNNDVGRLLNKKHPTELTEAVKKALTAETFADKARNLEILAEKYPHLKELAGAHRSVARLQFEGSQFKQSATRVRGMGFKTLEDVIKKYGHLNIPANLQQTISRSTAQSFRVLREVVSSTAHLRAAGGRAARTVAKTVTNPRMLAGKALVFMGTAPVFAADLALHMDPVACSDYRFGHYATTTSDGCDIIPEIGPPTREMLMSLSDDEIIRELRNPKFCNALLVYSSKSSSMSYRGQCTNDGFKIKPINSKTNVTYDFHTRMDGRIAYVERAESTRRSINIRFDDDEKLLPVEEMPEEYEVMRGMTLLSTKIQGCCLNYAEMDKDDCARFGISSAPSRGRSSGAPAPGSTSSGSSSTK